MKSWKCVPHKNGHVKFNNGIIARRFFTGQGRMQLAFLPYLFLSIQSNFILLKESWNSH
jgi:hypothetical protein